MSQEGTPSIAERLLTLEASRGRSATGDDDKDGTNYVRGGYLNRIEFGLRSGALFDPAPARVQFGVHERYLDPARVATSSRRRRRRTGRTCRVSRSVRTTPNARISPRRRSSPARG